VLYPGLKQPWAEISQRLGVLNGSFKLNQVPNRVKLFKPGSP
jgi:hypothetical protein